MKLFMGFSVVGAVLNTINYNTNAWAQTDPSKAWEIAQLGGTGGLIVCLLGAVWALWKDRGQMLVVIKEERVLHRQEISAMKEHHTNEINLATDRLLKEMEKQIELFKQASEKTREGKS